MKKLGQGVLVFLGSSACWPRLSIRHSAASAASCEHCSFGAWFWGQQRSYAFYSTVHRAYVIVSFGGLGWTATVMCLLDLAVRATPSGSEALGFSLMRSVRNLALFGSDWAGSKALEVFNPPFATLVLTNVTIP